MILIDPKDKRNPGGYLHLPVYANTPAANRLAKFEVFLRRSVMLPTKTDLRLALHLYPLESPPKIQELRQYPLLLPGTAYRLDDSLADYLAEGGW